MCTHRCMYASTRSTLLRYMGPRAGSASRIHLGVNLILVPTFMGSCGASIAVV